MLKKKLLVGIFFLLVILVFNEFTVASLGSADGTLELPNIILIRLIDGVLLGAGIALLVFRVRVSLNVILFNAVFLLLLLLLIEGGLFYLVHRTNPVLGNAPLHGIKRELYNAYKRVIQYDAECAQHDEFLGYTLKPGACTFSGQEFANSFQVNQRGYRDDEDSLKSPSIIVLGDSYAMGWGVEQEESFAQRLESASGKTVLNAAISSFGTARQVLSLERLDTNKLEALVFQYCHNDYEENEAFAEAGGTLKAMNAKRYGRTTESYEKNREYYIGKYLLHLFRVRGRAAHGAITRAIARWYELPLQTPVTAKEEATVFLEALGHSKLDLSKVRIVVLELGPCAMMDSAFVDALREASSKNDQDGDALDVEILDVSAFLTEEHYYPLDGHIHSEGHRVVAEELLKLLEQDSATQSPSGGAAGGNPR